MKRFALGAVLVISAGSCSLAPDEPIPATAITRIQAFLCQSPTEQGTCQQRGEAIALEELPPADDPFMVWVWHPGSNTTLWQLVSSMDNAPPSEFLATDSVGFWFHLQGAPAKTYTVRVEIKGAGANNILARDSLRWVFP
jgi:hypothetical protein